MLDSTHSRAAAAAPLADVFEYEPNWPVLSPARRTEVERLAVQPGRTV